jgi:NiFe hydrogenase small subunit HydA
MSTPCDETKLSRRDFLRLSLGGMTVTFLLPACDVGSRSAIGDDRTPILWVEAAVCTGCACSLLGSPAPAAETLIPELRLEFQETLMEACGTQAVDALLALATAHAGKFVLIVDGAIALGPAAGLTTVGTDSNLNDYTAEALVASLATRAASVVALGTCASFGGITASRPNDSAYGSLAAAIGRTPLRIPGCPPNPAWVTSVLSALLRGDPIALDALGRPTQFFGKSIHDLCPRRESFEKRDFAPAPGDTTRCLFQVGCKGREAKGDCPSRLWQGRSYCIKANHPCIGCTAPGFLDARASADGALVEAEGQAMAPFYGKREVLP